LRAYTLGMSGQPAAISARGSACSPAEGGRPTSCWTGAWADAWSPPAAPTRSVTALLIGLAHG